MVRGPTSGWWKKQLLVEWLPHNFCNPWCANSSSQYATLVFNIFPWKLRWSLPLWVKTLNPGLCCSCSASCLGYFVGDLFAFFEVWLIEMGLSCGDNWICSMPLRQREELSVSWVPIWITPPLTRVVHCWNTSNCWSEWGRSIVRHLELSWLMTFSSVFWWGAYPSTFNNMFSCSSRRIALTVM